MPQTNPPSGDNWQELVWTPQMIARFWNFESRRPQNFFTYQVGGALIHYFRRYLKSSSRIVDYGAGPGFLVEDLIASGHQCAAIEFAPDAVQLLSTKLAGNPKFLGAYHLDEISGIEGRFDVAFLIEVVEHLYDNDLDTCLDAVRRLLALGGVLIVTTPNDEDRSQSFIMNPETGKIFHRWQHVRSWSAASLQREICRRGFECVAIGATDLGASIKAARRSFPWPVRLARAVLKRLYLLLRPATAPHLYIVARKIG
jgi:2-polyprenyl-3-methyl-5-hydroxy-6-metoxy-1,4-benzoquinol methylase